MDEKVSFLAFCNLCEHLNRLQKVEQKKQKLYGFMEEWRRTDPATIFSFIRLLLPHLDNERDNYGLKESKLAEMYISALALPRESIDAQTLRNWQQTRHKDFSDALFEVLKHRLGEFDGEAAPKRLKMNTCCSLKDVNSILDQLTLSGDERRDLFLKLTAKMSSNEQKWLIRIILKTLRIGIPDNQILKLIHPDAPAVFDVCMDLSKLVRTFISINPSSYCKEDLIKVALFSPFRPMLAERQAIDKSALLLANSFLIEPKLDGERCQMHFSKSSGIFKYFSRHGTEYTYLYGRGGCNEGSLSPKIMSQYPFADDIESVVLDGEMVVYDPLIDKFLPFGTLKTSAGSKFDDSKEFSEPHPCLVVFDIVYWNGASLLDWTLEERANLLKNSVLIAPIKGYLEIIERSELKTSTEDIAEALEIAVQDQVEGLILKDPQSRYIPAHRSSHWIKIKPEYVEGMCDDLDLTIMGAWYGRTANIKASYGKANEFLCGVWSEDRSFLIPYVKIGSGYNSHEWSVINQHLEKLLIPTKQAPHSILESISELKGSERPELLVNDPHQSLVVQVKGSQLVTSETYKTLGMTLRFPRFVRIRLDRVANSSLNISELFKLKEMTAGTLSSAKTPTQSPTKKVPNRQKGKMAIAIERAISIIEDFNELPENDGNFLAGMEVLVLNGNDVVDKVEIEQKVRKYGGNVVQSPPNNLDNDDFVAIAGDDCGIRVKNYKSLGTFDLIKYDWLIECETTKTRMPLKAKNFFFLTERTKSFLASQKPTKLNSNAELKDLLQECDGAFEEAEDAAVSEICQVFLKHSICLPAWTRGFNEIIRLKEINENISTSVDILNDQFEKLKLRYRRARWI